MSDQQNGARNGEETKAANLPAAGYGDDAGLMVQQSLAVSLARAEVDQQVATARAMPRSIQRAINNITTLATLDTETATECIYALPRGGKTIRGPSIRFAEIAASQWGNCRIGARVVHVDRIEQYVEAEGVFHDLETNVAQTARVRRQIQAKRGKGIDNDMIQLAGAACCSIARRNAILAGIPKGVTRRGYTAVEEVLRGDIKTLGERRATAIKVFGVLGVTPAQLFASLGVQGESDITLDHLLTLLGTHSAIKNGEMTIEEAFPPPRPDRPKDMGEAIDKMVQGAGVGADEQVDPKTGEIKSAEVDYVEASSKGRLNGVPDKPKPTVPAQAADDIDPYTGKPLSEEGPANSNAPAQGGATAETSQAPQEGAQAASGTAATAAPANPQNTLLADLRATAEGRAQGGVAALRNFLDNLEPGERAMLSDAEVRELMTVAKGVKGPAK